MAGKRNKRDGSNWEREVRKDLIRVLGTDKVWTSRSKDKLADADGIDILVGVPIFFDGIQNKVSSKKYLNIAEIMNYIKAKFPVVLVKVRQKTGKIFKTMRKLAVMDYEVWLEMVKFINCNCEEFNKNTKYKIKCDG